MSDNQQIPKQRVLIQLDSDPHPSVFDRVVAIDAGVDHVFSYGGLLPAMVRDLVYGAIFTRGVNDLKRTAVFIGGSNVADGEKLLAAARKSFIGPLRVSLLLDSNGANTTAAAAVVVAGRHMALKGARALVLGSSGPVGRRVARLLALAGSIVSVGSRSLDRASEVAEATRAKVNGAQVVPVATGEEEQLAQALLGVELVISSGGPGACLLPRNQRTLAKTIRVVVDLNAVPPEGIEGVKGPDSGVERDGQVAYGAIGVGGLKMKIHKAAIAALFESNDLVLDVEQVLEIGQKLKS